MPTGLKKKFWENVHILINRTQITDWRTVRVEIVAGFIHFCPVKFSWLSMTIFIKDTFKTKFAGHVSVVQRPSSVESRINLSYIWIYNVMLNKDK